MASRENQHESCAVTRKIYRIPAADRVPAPLGKALPVVSREEVRTLLPDLTATGGYVLDKVEWRAIMRNGTMSESNDNKASTTIPPRRCS